MSSFSLSTDQALTTNPPLNPIPVAEEEKAKATETKKRKSKKQQQEAEEAGTQATEITGSGMMTRLQAKNQEKKK